jgi:hypothetical protein
MNSESSFVFVSPATLRLVTWERYKRLCARVHATYKRRLLVALVRTVSDACGRTSPPECRRCDKRETSLAQLDAIVRSRPNWSIDPRSPAGIKTTGHSSPFAAWHVEIVTFWGSGDISAGWAYLKKIISPPCFPLHFGCRLQKTAWTPAKIIGEVCHCQV